MFWRSWIKGKGHTVRKSDDICCRERPHTIFSSSYFQAVLWQTDNLRWRWRLCNNSMGIYANNEVGSCSIWTGYWLNICFYCGLQFIVPGPVYNPLGWKVNATLITCAKSTIYAWITLCMHPVTERRRCIVTSTLIESAYIQNNPGTFA